MAKPPKGVGIKKIRRTKSNGCKGQMNEIYPQEWSKMASMLKSTNQQLLNTERYKEGMELYQECEEFLF